MFNYGMQIKDNQKKNDTNFPRETTYNNFKANKYFQYVSNPVPENSYKNKSSNQGSLFSLINSESTMEILTKENSLKTENNQELKLDEFEIVIHSNSASVKEFFKFKQKSIIANKVESDSEVEDLEDDIIKLERRNESSKTNGSHSTQCDLINFSNIIEIYNKIDDIYCSLIHSLNEENSNFTDIIYSWFDLTSNDLLRQGIIDIMGDNYTFYHQLILEVIFFGFNFESMNSNEFLLNAIKDCLSYLRQNTLIIIFIILQKCDFINDANIQKSQKKLNDQVSWLHNLNYKKILSNNNTILNGMLLNLNDILSLETENLEEDHKISYTYNSKFLNGKDSKNKDIKITFDTIFSHYNQKRIKSNFERSKMKLLEDAQKYILPPNKTGKKYTLVLDLDETLVHYVDQFESSYILIRPGAEIFLAELSRHYELIVFTAATQEYADFVLEYLDKNNTISYRLYRQHTIQNEKKNNIKDLSKLGRDLKKTLIIDNTKENFQLQPENGIHIKDFIDDPFDCELSNLLPFLLEIAKLNPEDIRKFIKNIKIGNIKNPM